ncbi:MAG: hypothetical protein ABSF90_01450 [Syntrophobacteraceae bacterium]|jgi:hypothetical protein
MAEMILEPLAARLHFTFPDPMGISKWNEILAHFLAMLAKLCQDSDPCLIGHIKGLALLNGNCYIRASVVSASLPAQIETKASDEISEITFVLNILVFALSKHTLWGILEEVMLRSGTSWQRRVFIEPNMVKILVGSPSIHRRC